MIHTMRWVRLRHQVLSEYPCCQRCEKEGFVTASIEVHHRVPVETATTLREKESLMFDRGNLMALCHRCHVQEHVEMGRSGKKINTERQSARAREFNERFFGRQRDFN